MPHFYLPNAARNVFLLQTQSPYGQVIDITKDRAPYMPLYSQYPGCGELFGQLPVGKCVIQQHKGTTACGCGMDVCKNEFTACFRVPLKQAIYLLLDLFILLIFTSLLKPGAVRLPVRFGMDFPKSVEIRIQISDPGFQCGQISGENIYRSANLSLFFSEIRLHPVECFNSSNFISVNSNKKHNHRTRFTGTKPVSNSIF